ncbi:hypothetical protein GCM10009552_23210 [Rothia nasimurium]
MRTRERALKRTFTENEITLLVASLKKQRGQHSVVVPHEYIGVKSQLTRPSLGEETAEKSLGALIVQKPWDAGKDPIDELVPKPVRRTVYRYLHPCTVKGPHLTECLWTPPGVDAKQGPVRAQPAHIAHSGISRTASPSNADSTIPLGVEHSRHCRLADTECRCQLLSRRRSVPLK